MGEALFFRAQFYFGMMKSFGALPWINKPLEPSSPELFDARLPRNVIADSIISDLENAISYLPTKGSAQAGRLTKEVAMLFQSRVALFEGTWEKYHAGTPFGVQGSNGTAYLQKAAAVAEALINSGVQQLDNVGAANGYWSLFNKTDYSSSKEIMLWRQFDVTQGQYNNWHNYTTSGAGRGLTKNLVDYYLCTDGLPISVRPLFHGNDLRPGCRSTGSEVQVK